LGFQLIWQGWKSSDGIRFEQGSEYTSSESSQRRHESRRRQDLTRVGLINFNDSPWTLINCQVRFVRAVYVGGRGCESQV
jgi:hypothetical protein